MIAERTHACAAEVVRPVVREMPADVDTPISVYLKLRGLGPSFLLESVEGGEHLARYSMIGAQPRAILRSWPGRIVLEEEGRWREVPAGEGDVLDVLREAMPCYAGAPDPSLPRFSGGAVGYMGYDLVRAVERLPDRAPDSLGRPETCFLLSDRLVIYDHVKHRLLIVAHARVGLGQSADRAALAGAEAAIDEMAARLRRPLPAPSSPEGDPPAEPEPFRGAFAQEAFEEAVRRAQEHIAAGDIFQTVLSRRIHRRTRAEPFAIYRALRRVNPSPYMFYLELPDGLRLIGSSPEVLVRLEDGVV